MNVELGPFRERLAADALDLAAQQALLAELVKHSDNVDHMATVRGLLRGAAQPIGRGRVGGPGR